MSRLSRRPPPRGARTPAAVGGWRWAIGVNLGGVRFEVAHPDGGTDHILYAYNSAGTIVGGGVWSQNPGGDENGDGKSDPGDSAYAFDSYADGHYITVKVTSGISITTSGHDAPHQTPWSTKNVAEGHGYTMTACLEGSGANSCASVAVKS